MKAKKGLSDVNYLMFVCIPFGVVLLGIIFNLASGLVNGNIDTSKLQALVLEKRIMTSSNGIMYADKEIDRTYTGIIDSSRFDTAILDKAIDVNKQKLSAMLALRNLKTNEIKTAYINKIFYDRGRSLNITGGYNLEIRKKYVLIKDGDKLEPGLLRIEMVSKNE